MKGLFSKSWFLALLGFAVIGGLMFAYTTCGDPEPVGQMSRKQQRAAGKQIATDLKTAAASKVVADTATKRAAKDYQAGQQHEAAANHHHKASKPHAPTPVNRATLRAADSFLTNY